MPKPVAQLDYHVVDVEDWQLPQADEVTEWLLYVVQHNGRSVQEVNFVFTSDEYLLAMNREHLEHDYYTDIITFDLSPSDTAPIWADIFISIERVRENADLHASAFIDELHRVMAHGLLHICGFDDHNDHDRAEMRRAEDRALGLRMF
ncbi:MAG: rRNA maturation RNase YbeY [Bacteroidota bacterium]